MADKRIVTVDYLNSEGLNKGYINNTFANALKGSKSDTIVSLNDVSPVTHEMGVKVRGKNLFDKDNANILTVYFTKSGDVLKNATQTRSIWIPCLSNTTYTISKIASARFAVGFTNEKPMNGVTVNNVIQKDSATEITVTSSNRDKYIIVWFYNGTVDTSVTVEEILASMQIELGATATAYTPYVPDLTAVKVSRCGKNLFDKSTLRIDSGTKNLTQINNGFTFQTNATKTTMSVTCDIFLSVGTYYCSGTVSSSDGLKGGWGLYDPIKGVYIINASSRGTVNDRFTITESKTYRLSFFASYNSAADVTMTFTDVQLELGTTATDYEPYKECVEYTPTVDGTVNGVISLYPNTTLMTDTDGVLIDCEYNRDINKAFAELQQAIISLGGNV